MKILYIDCSSGISGDMTLAALVDACQQKEYLIGELKKLNLPGYELIIEKKSRNCIMMTDIDVKITADEREEEERNLLEICQLIDDSDVTQNAKEISKKIFKEIAEAEARVHGKSIEQIHFHEVGAVDSIVDIVGTAVLIDYIKPDKIISSPLHDGHGSITCRHGIIPVPVPAVTAMLEGSNIPVINENVDTELVTPTGCGIIKSLVDEIGIVKEGFTVEKVGYGMGKKETGLFGAVRIIIGESL
ncbi:nickel pincer cofactor biosynthesis protein LarC [Aminipila luticellarii]|uniref:LarC family nickel insertion protein n=1 Tax=Aminipila luticellarii TaxID=2507160 RepID=A0A410PS89_9FIRM|nr:LarC family nickel insertion protein [Aminipila luticellarii]QAT41755.1 LarC family nickel insertion protein [Aminipila luticellarii]